MSKWKAKLTILQVHKFSSTQFTLLGSFEEELAMPWHANEWVLVALSSALCKVGMSNSLSKQSDVKNLNQTGTGKWTIQRVLTSSAGLRRRFQRQAREGLDLCYFCVLGSNHDQKLTVMSRRPYHATLVDIKLSTCNWEGPKSKSTKPVGWACPYVPLFVWVLVT